MGKRKWCFGRRDVICLTADCKHMRGCIVSVYEQRVAEVVAMSEMAPEKPIGSVRRALRLVRKKKGGKL